MSLLEVNNLSVFFRGADGLAQQAVKDVSFELNEGEILGVVGESGSGKSVTALSLLGLLPYPKAFHSSNSSIKFEGKELIGNNNLQCIRGNNIAFVFQEPMSSLNPLHRIEKQISESLILHRGFNAVDAKKEVLRLLKMCGIKNPKQRMKAFPFELSGGQRQRVMIAMAMANNPRILIADEPTTALDVTIQKQIIDLLLNLRKKTNMSIVFISHDLRLVRKIADKVLVMQKGKVVEQGSIETIFENPKHDYTKTLIASSYSLKENNKINSDVVMTARDIRVEYPLKKNLWGKVTEVLKAVDGVSFSLYRGETLGVVGESGSGKTTLGMAISNLIKHGGFVSFENFNKKQNITQKSKGFRRLVQIVFQDPYNSLNPRMSVEEIVGEGLCVHFPELSSQEKYDKIVNILCEVGLDESMMKKYPHEFSGGQRQRIAIARALILEPEIVVLDEPTSALDVTIQKQIIELLNKLQKQRKISYIFISHDILAVRAISDRIAVMKDGLIVEVDTVKNIFNNPKCEYTKELIEAAI